MNIDERGRIALSFGMGINGAMRCVVSLLCDSVMLSFVVQQTQCDNRRCNNGVGRHSEKQRQRGTASVRAIRDVFRVSAFSLECRIFVYFLTPADYV